LKKLKNIISHLDDGFYKTIEDTFTKNRADNFLFLYRAYRSNKDDAEIVKELDLNTNSYYVLKSRLYDKIQSQLSGNINITREELIKKIDLLPQMCFTEPREVFQPYLEKIENDLLAYDMHGELLIVYSALKKINVHTDKYFYYSQLYNKHTAYNISIEKSEEILGNFNRILGHYNFSKSPKLLDELLFIKKQISDQYALNSSRQIEIIKNIIEVQLHLFCPINSTSNIEQLLKETRAVIDSLPDSSIYKYWSTALDYLLFEFYFQTRHLQQATVFYELVNEKLHSLLLFSPICCISNFLLSKIAFLQETGRIIELKENNDSPILFEINDNHAEVCYGIYISMINYYKGNLKEASNQLRKIINDNGFKDFFHIKLEVNFTLAIVYIALNEFDLALNLLKGVYRKIKSDKLENYSNALSMIKVLEYDVNNFGSKVTSKQKDDYTLFLARSKKDNELLKHFIVELNKKYS
jgi:hypothetical protein